MTPLPDAVSVRLTETQLAGLREQAEHQDRTVSWLIRHAVDTYLRLIKEGK